MLRPRKTIGRKRCATLFAILSTAGLAAFGQTGITTGVKVYLPLDGNFQDSVNDFDGTQNGATPIEFIDGKAGFGKAIKLAGPSDSGGADQYVEITGGEPDDLAFEGGSMSVSLWFTVELWDKQWQAVAAKGENNNWRIHRRGGEDVMGFTGGAGGDTPSGTKAVNDGQWHHLVAISDTTTLTSSLYIDGELDATRDIGALTANGQRVMIGENPDARNRYWHGNVDDFAIWDRAITEAEVKSLWANGAGKALSSFFAPPNDTDNDGMPNEWETQYGLNPNDPSDATQDKDGDGVTNLDEFKAGTDPADTTKPTIVAAATTSTFNTITITFSEEVDSATATNIANYTISPSLAVTAASYKSKVVTLTTAAQTPGATAYTVAVAGVKDTSKNEVAAGTTTTVYSYLLTKTGALKISVWENIPGTPVDGLYGDPRYPASPDRTAGVCSFNSRDYLPTDSLENYGATIEGFVTPTEAGNYRFFVSSDDASQLFVSTDATEANAQMVAEETACCNAFTEPDSPRTSEPQALVAGRSYFIRLVYKEGGGGDYGQVAWRKEGDTTPAGSLRPIPGSFLTAAVDVPAPPFGSTLTQTPAANAKNVGPEVVVTIVHNDGKTPWTDANVSLKFDGAAVTPTFTKSGALATITYDPPGLLTSKSSHTVALTYPDPVGQPTVQEWSFDVAEYRGPTLDKVQGNPGLIFGTANYTADKGGKTGATGDYAMDFPNAGGAINVINAGFANPAAATDKLTVAYWQKAIPRQSSAFWFNSPSSDSSTRGFQAHTPWDNVIYFDSAGCCDTDVDRISLGIDSFAGYTDPTWWQDWHHFAFVKNGPAKEIYVDGTLFHSGNGVPLFADFTNLIIGGGPGITDNRMNGTLDDFAVFSTGLTAAQVASLAAGTAPGAVTGNPGLIAHWDFNDATVSKPTLSVARSATGVTITFTGRLQSAATVNGPYADVAGATSPANISSAGAAAFYRSAQ
jgi:hypothetical protein